MYKIFIVEAEIKFRLMRVKILSLFLSSHKILLNKKLILLNINSQVNKIITINLIPNIFLKKSCYFKKKKSRKCDQIFNNKIQKLFLF